MKKILLAGSDGLIGSHLFQTLTQSGYEVHGLGNYKDKKEQNFSKVDLTNAEQCEAFARDAESYEILIFLVALAHSKGKGKDYPAFHTVNVQTLINLTNALKKHNKLPKQIIFSSSISIYGERWRTKYYPERLSPKGKTPYARTKIEAEAYLLKNFKEQSWILRFAPVYAKNFTLNIDRRTKIKTYYFRISRGRKKLSLLNIHNISNTILGIVQSRIPSGVYNLADTKTYTYNDLLNIQKADKIFPFPKFFIWALFVLGSMAKNSFLIENSIKLATDNIYPSDKIQQYIKLGFTLND